MFLLGLLGLRRFFAISVVVFGPFDFWKGFSEAPVASLELDDEDGKLELELEFELELELEPLELEPNNVLIVGVLEPLFLVPTEVSLR